MSIKISSTVLLLCALLAVAGTGAGTGTGTGTAVGRGDGAAMDAFRLPTNSSPTFYELRFAPRFDGFDSTFAGAANITVAIVQSTNVITLNAKGLDVGNVTVTDVTGVATPRPLPVKEVRDVPRNEQLEIHLRRTATAGRTLVVGLRFGGKMRTDMAGLYVSSYAEGNATK